MYARLEERLLGAASAAGLAAIAPAPPEPALPAPSKPAKFSDKAEAYLHAHPCGVRAYEVAKAIGQPTKSAFVTLRFLERQGRSVQHGHRATALWTPPGFKPLPRTESCRAAILHVLKRAKAPLAVPELSAKTIRLVKRSTGRHLMLHTIMSELSELALNGMVERCGADEHGALYRLATATEKGGAVTTTDVLN